MKIDWSLIYGTLKFVGPGLIVAFLHVQPAQAAVSNADIKWRGWDAELFKVALRDNKLVLLNLEAVWCHWCHVMDERTYSDPAIKSLLDRGYIAVRVDQDAVPDLSNRYQDYGWPATIVFASDGTELTKRSGYIPKARMLALLQDLSENPVALADSNEGSELVLESQLGTNLKTRLEKRFIASHDATIGGFNISQKFLDRNHVEYAMLLASQGNRQARGMSKRTLDAALALLDPTWGGFYQYSTHQDWMHPHFEKLMKIQSAYLRSYSLAYGLYADERYLEAAKRTAAYMQNFLQANNGAFYVSQDADLNPGEHAEDYFALSDKARRARGIPRVDQHLYARENGWASEAFATLYRYTQEPKYLETAVKSADWIIQNRALPKGGYRHDVKDEFGPYLGDTLYAGRAFLELYRVTGDSTWLDRALAAAGFIARNFADEKAGFVTSKVPPPGLKAYRDLEENIQAVRFFNLLETYTGLERLGEQADHGMRYLGIPAVALKTIDESGILLADQERSSDPVHLTIQGSKDDARAAALFAEALRVPGWYARIEWWDPVQGSLPNKDIEYPVLNQPAAFVCANGRCSLPVFEVNAYRERIVKLTGGAQ